jgi:hypothetical protein
LAHPFKQVWRSIVIAVAAAASASPLAAASCASERLIVPFAAKAKLGGKITSKIHSTKRMMASPFFAIIRCEENVRFTARKRVLCLSLVAEPAI